MSQFRKLALIAVVFALSSFLWSAAQDKQGDPHKEVGPKKAVCVLTPTKGSKVSGTTPYLRQMSMAALRVVPAASMKVSGRLTNASVSFEAIQVKRGDSSSVLVSFPAATRW